MNPGLCGARYCWTLTLILCVIVFAFSLSGTVRASVALVVRRTIAAIHPVEFALIGDSLTRDCRWDTLSSDPSGVVNLAKGGSVIRQIASQIGDARLMGARVALIMAGANDMILDHAPVSKIELDYKILLRAARNIPLKVVTLLPYGSDASAAEKYDLANAAIRRVAERENALVIDINSLISERGRVKAEMTTDGIHLSSRACRAWYDAIIATPGVVEGRRPS